MGVIHGVYPLPRRPLLAAALICFVLVSGCVRPAPLSTPGATPGVHLVVAACPGAQTRHLRWIEIYRAEHPEISLELLTMSATQAQQALIHGEADLAFLDQHPALIYQGLVTATHVAEEPLVLVVHPENPLRDLTVTALVELLSGGITDWSQVGGDAGPVQIYLLPGSAGETVAFARQAMGDRHLSNQAIVRTSPPSMRQAVVEDPRGIGLLAVSDVTPQVVVLQIEGTPPTAEGYPWQMPLFLAYGPASPDQAHALIRFIHSLEGQP